MTELSEWNWRAGDHWVTPLSHSTFAVVGGNLSPLCFAPHGDMRLRTPPPLCTDAHVTLACFLMICPALPLQSETMNGLEKWGPSHVFSPHDRIGSRKLEWDAAQRPQLQ